MKKALRSFSILFLLLFFSYSKTFSQTVIQNSRPAFPQQKINDALQKAFEASDTQYKASNFQQPTASPRSISPMMQHFKNFVVPEISFSQKLLSNDTIVVGASGNDTLVITGNWTHTGPIWVLNQGVLIFDNATVIDTGDIYVFGNGKMFADSSSLTFPQQYFYERGLFAVQNGYVRMQNCSLNYSGFSHNLLIADSAIVELTSIHQNDFTTCGLFGNPTLNINGCNLTGEYILTSHSNSTFTNADTLILWHYFPDTAVVNYSFPAGDTVYNYVCNNTVNGISGIGYSVTADSCHNVMWAMMPVNGSDITISNSTLRLIGCWFERGDSVSVSGLYNNSSYSNFTAPLADRNLHLINTDVQTWSLYVFDSSHINIDSCQLGEVGTQQSSTVMANPFLLDGSGGYFWATDTSGIIAAGATVYSTTRSERKGIFVLAYSWLPFMPPTAIGNSLIVCVQNNLAFDPVPYDASVAWLQNISQPDSANINSIVPVTGSAWIDNGPLGGWMNFGSYSLHYQQQGSSTWNAIVIDSLIEIHNTILGNWNTNGLAAGNYLLKLTVKNNLTDSVEAIRPVTLQQFVSVAEVKNGESTISVSPNPFQQQTTFSFQLLKTTEINLFIYDALGNEIKHFAKEKLPAGNHQLKWNARNISSGIYFYRFSDGENIFDGKIEVLKKY